MNEILRNSIVVNTGIFGALIRACGWHVDSKFACPTPVFPVRPYAFVDGALIQNLRGHHHSCYETCVEIEPQTTQIGMSTKKHLAPSEME